LELEALTSSPSPPHHPTHKNTPHTLVAFCAEPVWLVCVTLIGTHSDFITSHFDFVGTHLELDAPPPLTFSTEPLWIDCVTFVRTHFDFVGISFWTLGPKKMIPQVMDI
jgi:hypothetical protein